jgi:Saxitoxin biosynthesis operon protein SxtJ
MNTAHNSLFNPTLRVLRQFAALLIVFLGAVAGRQEFHHHRRVPAIVLATLAMTLGPAGLAWPRVIKPVFVAWMFLAYPIGWTVSRIVLGGIFFGLFTPVALFFRMTKRDALGLKPQPRGATYWLPRPGTSSSSQYLRQF